jgi:hypothetical protein
LISSLVSLPPSLLVILCASFFGVHAVAASALLTLPFQTAVAMLFIGRHLSLGFGDIARALLKSMVVTTATVSGVLVCAWLIETGIASSLVGLTLALCAAPLCWWLGLAFTGHPLLRQLQHAAGGLALIAPRLMPGRPVL